MSSPAYCAYCWHWGHSQKPRRHRRRPTCPPPLPADDPVDHAAWKLVCSRAQIWKDSDSPSTWCAFAPTTSGGTVTYCVSWAQAAAVLRGGPMT